MAASLHEEVEEIARLRRQGVLTAKEAYERHLAATAAWTSGGPPTPVSGAGPAVPGSGPLLLQPAVVALAVVGSALAIPGIVVQEAQAGLLAPFIVAPIIEEALKPTGVYLVLILWPRALLGRLHAAMLGAIAGLSFGLLESYLYVTFYYPEGDAAYVLFRFTVPVLLHVIASAMVGYGLHRGVVDWATGNGPFPRSTRNFYVAAVLLHAAYNATVVVLGLTGDLRF